MSSSCSNLSEIAQQIGIIIVRWVTVSPRRYNCRELGVGLTEGTNPDFTRRGIRAICQQVVACICIQSDSTHIGC